VFLLKEADTKRRRRSVYCDKMNLTF
jgi:hypothetical protein